MKKIYLLKPYQNNPENSIITVSNNIAFGLIDSGQARAVINKDFLVKPEFGISRAIKSRHNVYRKT